MGNAIQRLRSMERRFARDTNFMNEYQKFMLEYYQLSHMQEIPQSDVKDSGFYLPHHGVLRSTSTTTKLRVVFDGSAKSSSGFSLNDCLAIGPTTHSTLYSILLRFREHSIVFSADVEKMYRQVQINDADTEYQKINDITNLLKQRGFILRKWSSNSTTILDTLHNDDKPNKPKEIGDISNDTNQSVKVLGITWNPSTDEFIFISDLRFDSVITKRTILSQASRLFDPLGWLAPVIVSVKIFIQQLWAQNLDWDDPLPERRATSWLRIYEDMKRVNQIRIPRSISNFKPFKVQMHGFCDASQQAYAAVVYFRLESPNGDINCKLISAKTKVAPIKQATLPRLELCGALLLVNLLNLVKKETQMTIDQVYCWTDSTIVLDWLASHPRRWSTFVGNRTAEILNSWSRQHWRHVSSSYNSADCASRGLFPFDQKSQTLWWNGPEWLSQPSESWPSQQTEYGHIEEESNQQFAFTTTIPVTNTWFDDLISKYSSFQKLTRILSLICRYINNLRNSKGQRSSGIYLSRNELFDAGNRIYRHEQLKYYSTELKSLKSKNCIAKTSSLRSLYPFIDEYGVIRVGGRLKNSLESFSIKHPIIIHAKSRVTFLLVNEIHKSHKHAGPSLTLALARQQVWIPGGKNIVKEVINKCIVCTRFKAQVQGQLMGDLPRCRVEYVRPFLKTGVDYAGPLFIHLAKGRGQKTYKVYVCLFICLSTKAIHLELVTDMTSDAFLSSLKRFIARRGVCEEIYSDNGSNFIGANNQLREEFNKLLKQSNDISNYSSKLFISWHFNPPSAPHLEGYGKLASNP